MAAASAPALATTVLGKPRTEVNPSVDRLVCVDLLRGAVMILMALDHTRSFFTDLTFAPEDLHRTYGALFFTRFVTHFCAPTFFLLAGTGVFLAGARGKSVNQVSRYLWTRGLWLLLLSATVVGHAWTYQFFIHADVIWALASSMIVMALLVRLPMAAIAVFGAGMIATHNLLDGFNPAALGSASWLWFVLHRPGVCWIPSVHAPLLVVFPLIPWVGVMAAGYALGPLLLRQNRAKVIFWLGAALTLAFFVLRTFHLYGNGSVALQPVHPDSAGPWRLQPTLALSVVAFFNTVKFPASLQFLLMTLGPSLMALAWLDKLGTKNSWTRILQVFGRVPLFYYVSHLYLIHVLAVWTALLLHQPAAWLLYGAFYLHPIPPGYGHGLPFIYAIWCLTVALLYYPCRWFMNVKREHPQVWWLSYL
ncbi:MAG TPA: heparan-alpha-glucosaminide N-acetyltransferase domain-containing protein [Terriglobales bacterium]|nr:heparan-alpha-glucosaminide N-acetyltransferase domain-containing protein [Terriglobales bacterium]